MKKCLSYIVCIGVMSFLMSSCGIAVGLIGKSAREGTPHSNQNAIINEATVKDIIVIGRTTKHDILIEYGEPSKTMENEGIFIYSWRDEGKAFLFGGTETRQKKSLIVFFDQAGIATRYKIWKAADKLEKE